MRFFLFFFFFSESWKTLRNSFRSRKMEVFIACQLPANWTLLSVSPPDLVSISFSARRQKVTPVRIFQAGSQSQMLVTCFLCLSSSQHPQPYQAYFQFPNHSHERSLTIMFPFFLFFFPQVDNRNGNNSHNFSTENPNDFFQFLFFSPYGEFRLFLFSERIALWSKIILP